MSDHYEGGPPSSGWDDNPSYENCRRIYEEGGLNEPRPDVAASRCFRCPSLRTMTRPEYLEHMKDEHGVTLGETGLDPERDL